MRTLSTKVLFQSPFDLEGHGDHVVVVSSLSKSHSMTGWRCGWAVGPEALISRVRDVSEAMMFGAQPFLQDAAAFAVSHDFEECGAMYDDYRRRAALVRHAFAGSSAISSTPPTGWDLHHG